MICEGDDDDDEVCDVTTVAGHGGGLARALWEGFRVIEREKGVKKQ